MRAKTLLQIREVRTLEYTVLFYPISSAAMCRLGSGRCATCIIWYIYLYILMVCRWLCVCIYNWYTLLLSTREHARNARPRLPLHTHYPYITSHLFDQLCLCAFRVEVVKKVLLSFSAASRKYRGRGKTAHTPIRQKKGEKLV